MTQGRGKPHPGADGARATAVATDSESTKARIVRTAAELFARRGYDATGVAEIGEAVGLGRGALYHHIESKEALLYEICVLHVRDLVGFAENLLDLDLPADMKVRRLSRQLMRVISHNLEELTVFFHDFRALSAERAESIANLRQRFEEAWLAILREGAERGVFRPVNPILVKGILGMHNYSYLWLTPNGALEPEEIADVFCDTLLRGIAASGVDL
jgi:AcrR family transcriptional regulator